MIRSSHAARGEVQQETGKEHRARIHRSASWILTLLVRRMEAALAEFKAEDLGQDVEDDNDFTVDIGMFS